MICQQNSQHQTLRLAPENPLIPLVVFATFLLDRPPTMR
jgi:hypothetical protein